MTSPTTTFADLGLASGLIEALEKANITTPTQIQVEAIPAALAGRDLMAMSPTGSGKTAAFILPALHHMQNPSSRAGIGPRMLVLAPTRELATQVEQAARTFARNIRGFKSATVLGGMPYPPQMRALSSPLDLLIATPGRLMDHMERGRVDFSRVEWLVLDEADRMLDMGFVDDIEHICQKIPAARQTFLFSATLDGVVGGLAKRLLNDPLRIQIKASEEKRKNITQLTYYTDNSEHKEAVLNSLLSHDNIEQAIIFTATKRDADKLAQNLRASNIHADALHGDMPQQKRTRTLDRLRQRRIRVLVATDVAARGIDVDGITHVFNYALPRSAEDYVHRIGRTGRAGRSGTAINLVGREDWLTHQRIGRFVGQMPQIVTIDGMEPNHTPPADGVRPPSKGKKRGSSGAPAGRRGGGGARGGYAERSGSQSGDRRPRRNDERTPRFADSRPAGERAPRFADSRPAGDRPYADRAPRPAGDRPYADRAPRSAGDRPYADRAPRSAGERPYADRAPRSAGDRPYADRAPRPAGDRPYADRAPRPAGDRPYADRAPRPAGERRSRSDNASPRKFGQDRF